MKANLIIVFEYSNKSKKEKEQKIVNLLMNFCRFCDETLFEFQAIPNVGEYIIAEALIAKWIENKEFKKPFRDAKTWDKIISILRTGFFRVEKVYHSFDACTIICSDVECQEVE